MRAASTSKSVAEIDRRHVEHERQTQKATPHASQNPQLFEKKGVEQSAHALPRAIVRVLQRSTRVNLSIIPSLRSCCAPRLRTGQERSVQSLKGVETEQAMGPCGSTHSGTAWIVLLVLSHSVRGQRQKTRRNIRRQRTDGTFCAARKGSAHRHGK